MAVAIIFALRQADTGVPVGEVYRKMGVSEATYYNWKKKYAGLGVAELRKLRQLEEENQKQLVADLSLDKQMLQDILKKSFEASPETDAGRKLNEKLSGCRPAGMFCCLLSDLAGIINRIVVPILLFVIELGKLHKFEFVMDIKESSFT